MISEELKAFLTEWLAWAESGAPRHPIFTPKYGLCTNSMNWEDHQTEERFWNIHHELKALLIGTFPFGRKSYDSDEIRETQHLNPQRLAWVKEQLRE